MTFGDKVLEFYKDLSLPTALPEGIEVMNPYRDREAFEACRAFYGKYYHDNRKRFLILGINPGRYGAGITGIPFTDPVKLETQFGIRTALPKKPELSADFIHRMIDAYGGYTKFFSRFFINSVSPLGFVQRGKNLNYYDVPALRLALEPFITKSIRAMLSFGVHDRVAFCLGEGENYRHLTTLNAREHFFEEIIPLAHPRFIMQYRRKEVERYIGDYLRKLGSVPAR